MLENKSVLLIISGGIAAYKSLELIRRLRDRGADVRCVLTEGGSQFVTPLSVAALSENKVYGDLFSLTDESEMGHIRLSGEAELAIPLGSDLHPVGIDFVVGSDTELITAYADGTVRLHTLDS